MGRRRRPVLDRAVPADHLPVPAARADGRGIRRAAGVHAAQPGGAGPHRTLHARRMRLLRRDGQGQLRLLVRARAGTLAGILAPVRPGTALLRRHPVRRVPTAGGTALRSAPAQGPDGRRSARGVGAPRGCQAASPSQSRPRDGYVGLVAPSGSRPGGGRCRSGPCAAAAARACRRRAPPAAARGGRSNHSTGAAGIRLRDPAQVCRGPTDSRHWPMPCKR